MSNYEERDNSPVIFFIICLLILGFVLFAPREWKDTPVVRIEFFPTK
jgi:hypothetical protein